MDMESRLESLNGIQRLVPDVVDLMEDRRNGGDGSVVPHSRDEQNRPLVPVPWFRSSAGGVRNAPVPRQGANTRTPDTRTLDRGKRRERSGRRW